MSNPFASYPDPDDPCHLGTYTAELLKTLIGYVDDLDQIRTVLRPLGRTLLTTADLNEAWTGDPGTPPAACGAIVVAIPAGAAVQRAGTPPDYARKFSVWFWDGAAWEEIFDVPPIAGPQVVAVDAPSDAWSGALSVGTSFGDIAWAGSIDLPQTGENQYWVVNFMATCYAPDDIYAKFRLDGASFVTSNYEPRFGGAAPNSYFALSITTIFDIPGIYAGITVTLQALKRAGDSNTLELRRPTWLAYTIGG